jgi:hypothetical protein
VQQALPVSACFLIARRKRLCDPATGALQICRLGDFL